MSDTELLETLAEHGVDVKGTLDRFMGNESLYIKFLKKFPSDPNFSAMEESLRKRDFQELLIPAHALKGLTGNLGLNYLYERLAQMVADLRAFEYGNIDRLEQEIRQNYEEICIILKE